jgi:putative ABC transport system permease protein
MAFRVGLLKEVLGLAVDTLIANKLRSFLTVLGVVIGVSSIVGMTALIRGFGDSFEQLIREMGSDTVYVAKLSISSFASGKSFFEVLRRPDITPEDAMAIRALPSVQKVSLAIGQGPGGWQARMAYRDRSTKQMIVIGATAVWPDVNYLSMEAGRFFSDFEVTHRRNVVVLGSAPALSLFPDMDPLGKQIRIGADSYTVVGVFKKRPSPIGGGVNEFAVVPFTTHEKKQGPFRIRGIESRFRMIGAMPAPGVSRDQLIKDIEEVMRSRHRLKLDKENDFDIVTSDVVMKIFNQFTQAVVLALVVISSIALMVGGIGVMAIMTISVTERTREIGVRKALGARRREILWQFLIEAVFLTSIGGLSGILLGSAIGLIVNYFAGFPVSLPWWSFALGLGFSATVGIFFGMFPAIKAARLDPIEALRYE